MSVLQLSLYKLAHSHYCYFILINKTNLFRMKFISNKNITVRNVHPDAHFKDKVWNVFFNKRPMSVYSSGVSFIFLSRGGHSQTNVLPTRVQTPQKWTLNCVLRHIKFAPLNGVTPVKHNLNGVIMGVTNPKWRTLLWYTVQYPKWRTLLWYTLQYPKWRTVYMVHSTIP